jgi:hypothetical protein
MQLYCKNKTFIIIKIPIGTIEGLLMSPKEQEEYFWEDFQHVGQSSWQIIIFYFGIIGLLTFTIADNWNNKIYVFVLLIIGRFFGQFILIHVLKYRFYALRDMAYLKEHGCELFDDSKIKKYKESAMKQLKKDMGLLGKFAVIADSPGVGFRLVYYFISFVNTILLLSIIIFTILIILDILPYFM